MTTIRMAAVQMCAKLADVDRNLAQAESLADAAFRKGAQWVILPEFFPTAVAFAPAMLDAWSPLEGPPLAMMRALARRHDGVVGGSFIARREDDCYNSFLLVFPDGTVHRHDKDMPTMWEGSYYVGGMDEGLLSTPAGNVGVAMCWELIRSETARRLRGRVDLVVGGSCWWDLPHPVAPKFRADQEVMHGQLRDAPGRLARRLRVPVVHASHAGSFEGLTPGKEHVPYTSRYLGETRIVDGEGCTLARMAREDGEGFVLADIKTGMVAGEPDPIPSGFWTVELTPGEAYAWDHLNALAGTYYRDTFRPRLVGGASAPAGA